MVTSYKNYNHEKWGKLLKKISKNIMSCLDHCTIQKYQITKYWVNILRIGLFRKTKYLWSTDKSSKLFDSKLIFFIIQRVWEFKSWFPTFKSSSYWSRMVLGFYLWKDFTITDIGRKVLDVTLLFLKVIQNNINPFKRVAASWLVWWTILSFHLVCGAFLGHKHVIPWERSIKISPNKNILQ